MSDWYTFPDEIKHLAVWTGDGWERACAGDSGEQTSIESPDRTERYCEKCLDRTFIDKPQTESDL